MPPEIKFQIYKKLLLCHFKACLGKRRTKDEHKFELNLFQNVYKLTTEISTFTYTPSPGIAFVTRDPVIREIFAAPYRDRIVHHYVFSSVINYWERQFIFDSYSCRDNKGPLIGSQRALHFMRSAQNCSKNSQIYIFKYDLTGYFMSLPRKKLYKAALKGLLDQFKDDPKNYQFYILKYLWRQIIFNDPIIGIKIRGNLKNWNDLPKTKSLFYQPKGQGIVIGNLTSQLLSNIYLNDFDHYMKEWCGLKYYGRYVDDFYFLTSDPKKALETEKNLRNYLLHKNLRLNTKKTYRQPINHGMAFLGSVVYPNHTNVGKRIKSHFYEAALAYSRGQADIDLLITYVGMVKHYDSTKLVLKLLGLAGVL